MRSIKTNVKMVNAFLDYKKLLLEFSTFFLYYDIKFKHFLTIC